MNLTKVTSTVGLNSGCLIETSLSCWTMLLIGYNRGRNNYKISGSQQDYLVEKSGSSQIHVVVMWPRFKQNNMTNTQFEKYSQILW